MPASQHTCLLHNPYKKIVLIDLESDPDHRADMTPVPLYFGDIRLDNHRTLLSQDHQMPCTYPKYKKYNCLLQTPLHTSDTQQMRSKRNNLLDTLSTK